MASTGGDAIMARLRAARFRSRHPSHPRLTHVSPTYYPGITQASPVHDPRITRGGRGSPRVTESGPCVEPSAQFGHVPPPDHATRHSRRGSGWLRSVAGRRPPVTGILLIVLNTTSGSHSLMYFTTQERNLAQPLAELTTPSGMVSLVVEPRECSGIFRTLSRPARTR